MMNLQRSLFFVLSLAAFFFVSDAASAQDHLRVFCSECRDPNVHPSDFGNAAFNVARAPDSGLTFDDLDAIEIVNSAGQWAWVDLAFEMLDVEFGLEIPTFVVPTGNIIIEVTDSNGRLTSYVIDLDIPNHLTVGTGTGPGYNPNGGSSSSGSGGGGDDYEDWGDYWDGWENGYGGQLPWYCVADFSDPHNTTIVCSR